jgi:hypothetical protein
MAIGVDKAKSFQDCIEFTRKAGAYKVTQTPFGAPL